MKALHKTLVATLASAVISMLPVPAISQQPIKIGFMAELSGTQAALGQDMYDGFMLFVNKHGGKLGGHPVEIIKADSQLKPEIGVQLARRLIEHDKVPIIVGVTFSNIMVAVYKPITEKQVFLIGTNAGPSQMAGKECSPFFYSTSWQNDQQSEVIGAYAATTGYKRIITMVPNYQSGFDFIAGFKRYYKKTLLDEIYTPLNQLDYSAELTQVASQNPDALYIFYPGALGVNFLRQYQQAGLLGKIPLLSNSTTDAVNLPSLKDTALGVITGTAWGPDVQNNVNKEFVADFEKTFKRIPSHYAAQSYDGAQLLDVAIRSINGDLSNKLAFQHALKTANFQSVRGDFKFNSNNFPIQDMRVFQVVKDDRFGVTLKTIDVPLKRHKDAYYADCPMK